jgi:hypothetical protein
MGRVVPESKIALLAFFAYVAVFVAVVFPAAVGWRAATPSFDESRCYLPAIAQMRRNFPAVDLLRDSMSASPPGYTHLLAGLSIFTGSSLPVIRGWHVVLSFSGAVFLLLFVGRLCGDTSLAIACMLPAVASGYYLKSSAQLTTDNLALVLGLSAATLVLFGANRPRNAMLTCLCGIAAVYVRQIWVWVAIPVAARALAQSWHSRRLRNNGSLAWTVAAVGILAPLCLFIWSWHGLVPPLWSQTSGGLSGMPLIYCTALVGIYGGFYLSACADGVARKSDVLAFVCGSTVGVVLFFLIDSSPNYEAGRYGGYLWSLAGSLPVWGRRSYLFLPLSALGCGLLALAAWQLYEKSAAKAFLWSTTLAAWLATGLVNRQVFHRYYESPVLAFLGLWLLLSVADQTPAIGRRRLGILYGLSLLLMASGVYSILTSPTGFATPIVDR